jgi:exodeoxyribonuclease VII small subunit
MADEARGFDEVLGALRAVVERLESGQLGLEASLTAFEEGVALAKQGATILDAAEKRVEVLTRPGEAGESAIAPFPTTPTSESL